VLGAVVGAAANTSATETEPTAPWCWVEEEERCYSDCDGGPYIPGGPKCWLEGHVNGDPPPD
jgi:hypothetical protein